MRSHELFKRMSPATAAEVFAYLQKEQKPVYKAAIQGLANQRNLRGVFIERKPPNERYPWMQQALSRPISDALASHLLQGWLLGANKPMLNDFLDALGIAHEEDGTVEELPACAAEGADPLPRSINCSRNIRRKRWRFICTPSATWTAACNGRR